MATETHAPSKASLKLWWQAFTAQKNKKEAEVDVKAGGVFGTPLKESLKVASVQISTSNINGELLIWGYIPVVVAKCGLFLKTNATEVPGTFRVNGSNKRMRELQAIFETAPRYGKNLDWRKGGAVYTTHDVASVFRRYLTQMPEPVIPHDLYHKFRDALSATSDPQVIITTYKRLIGSMPRANQYLLLYVLDLLSVFARKSEKNLMTPANLAVIFRPGLISHPNHEMSPTEHNLSQQVLEFLIAHQDWFLLDIPPVPDAAETPTPGHQHAGSSSDDIIVSPSSDEDQSSQKGGGGGWKAAVRGGKIGRRKTVMDRRDEAPEKPKSLSPVTELTPVREASAGVTRSRTLPSSRKGPEATAGEDRKLRKQRRSSSQKRGDAAGG